METLLLHIVKDASGNKHADLRKAAQDAHDFLEVQQGSIRAPPHELRQTCLNALEKALSSKQNKLMLHAVSGLQKLLRDDRFHSSFECENEMQWLPTQLLQAVGAVQLHSDEIQIELLKVLLNMACTNWWTMNAKMIQQIFQLCLDVYIDGNSAIRTAAQATANQTLRSFCNYLEEESKAQQSNPFQHTNEKLDVSSYSVFEDVIPVFNYLCKKVDEYQRIIHTKGTNPLVLLLEGILTLVSCLPLSAIECSSLLNFLWQKLCPSLVAFLGSPRTDKNIVSSQRSDIVADRDEVGRGSGCLASAPTFSSAEARMVYSIAIKLVDLVGMVPSLRPMFESLFHRMLLYPPAQHRLEAIKSVKEILQSPDMLLRFTGPPLFENGQTPQRLELSLLALVMDAIVECSRCSDANVCYASVSCAVSLLGTLEKLCLGNGFSDWQLNYINALYKDLSNCDYTGPFTYKAREKLMTTQSETKCCGEDGGGDDSKESRCEPAAESVSKGAADSDADNEDDESGYQGDQEDADGEENHDGSAEDDKSDVKCSITADKGDGAEVERPRDGREKPNFEKRPEDSDSSGDTEGPEDGRLDEDENEIDESLDEAVKKLAERETTARREKVPKTLLCDEVGRTEREQLERLCELRNEFAQMERSNARHFAGTLRNLLPSYLAIRSSIEVDEAFQEFASKYCEGVYDNQNISSDQKSSSETIARITIINADGVYLATYASLSLNLKLIRKGYYKSLDSNCIPLTEEQFIEEVHGSGVLVYLSTLWLSELYQHITQRNFLEEAGYDPNSTENSAVINLLTDLDGLNSEKPGDQLLSDYRRLEKAATNDADTTAVVKAGMKFSRCVLTCCWNNLLEVLSFLLNGKNSIGITSNICLILGMESAKEDHRKTRDAVASSLEGLHKAAQLCNILGLQSRCNAVFALLADVSCPAAADSKATSGGGRIRKKNSFINRPNKSLRLHVAHVLSMDVLLSRGLELGSHSSACWRHVFRCCIYVANLEHDYFTHAAQNNVPKSGSLSSLTKLQKRFNDLQSSNTANNLDFSNDDDLQLQAALSKDAASTQQVNLSELLQKLNSESTSGIIFHGPSLLQVICGLCQQIDRLFDDAATKLNLRALTSFMTELCAASQTQLFTEMFQRKPIPATALGDNHAGGLLLLYRLGDVMLRCVRSGRPLIHTMKAWSIAGPHFMEAACHSDRIISKKAISCIHDIVTALLGAQSELPHFHFNEALFKPFENLLYLELCDMDVQDQIISSICEFVEGSTTEIRSGWRPLFGTLRAVGLSVASPNPHGLSGQINVVMDVFEAFLSTDNVLVFANAAVDCILCLLKHVRGGAEKDDREGLAEGFNLPSQMSLDLCLASLKYIHRASTILASMYQMPSCPIFYAAHRIKLNSNPQFVDPLIPNLELIHLDQELDKLANHLSATSKEATEILMRIEATSVTLDAIDRPSGILHVWFLLLEGLVGAVSTCDRKHQPYTMEALFVQLRSLMEIPGPIFGIYTVNHLLLPMLQAWLRRTSKLVRGWNNYAPNFKQCCGLTTDLVVDYITRLHETGRLETVHGVTLMLKQLALVLIECITQPVESISRLGCACLRHVIVSAGPYMGADLWEIMCLSLHRACTVSLHSLYQLMEAFHADSDNFYGDIGQVKVATRTDCSPMETMRLQQIAQQVFLLETQHTYGLYGEPSDEDNRSYIFLLCPPNVEHTLNPDLYIIKVPFRNLVVGLLSHLILLQTVGSLLLQGSPYIVPSLANVLLASPATTPCEGPTSSTTRTSLPGVLSQLTDRSLHILLDVLSVSYHASYEFDLRPGLKFLIQKVAQAEVAANLYKQAGASWTMNFVTLMHLVINDEQFCAPNAIKKVLQPVVVDGGGEEERSAQSADWGQHVRKFHNLLTTLCERYVEMVLDADGKNAQADKMSDEPMFFLVAQPDDFPDITSPTDIAKDLEKVPQPPTDAAQQSHSVTATQQQQLSSGSVPVSKQASIDSSDSEQANSDSGSGADKSQDSQDSPKAVAEKSEDGDDNASRVYTLATQKDIESMMQEYKRRKNVHAMPNRATPADKRRGSDKMARPREHVPDEIAAQRVKSLLKDSEAHMKVYGEMLLSVFDLLCQLNDAQFKALLPVTFPVVQTLVAHAQDSTVRQTTAEYLQRVATLHSFTVDD